MELLSLTFFAFLAVVLAAYYWLPKRMQTPVLLIANYVFYMWHSAAFGALLLAGTAVSYGCGCAVARGKRKKLWLLLCIFYILGLLFLFKYLNFTIGIFDALLGIAHDPPFLQIGMPIGISFFSFSMIGYVMDVYRGKIDAERNFLRFAAFASLFPSVLSGPINRARELLPQLSRPRSFDTLRFRNGLWRFVCGAAKKLIVASGLAVIVDTVYAATAAYGSGTWILTAVCYSLQIYVDFSAYSDMAVGAGGMLGLTLAENFRAPYLSCSVKSFWKKWHISLTSWFREYLYFPLGGSRKGKVRTALNVLIVFAVSGLWHGASLTFLVWGLLNGIYQVAGQATQPWRSRVHEKLHLPKPVRLAWQGLVTFTLVTAAWVFFRAGSLTEALFILRRILLVFRDGLGIIEGLPAARERIVLLVGIATVFLGDCRIALDKRSNIARHTWCFWLCTALLVLLTLLFGHYGPGFSAQDFVYFKF